jgi:hypothetical protein
VWRDAGATLVHNESAGAHELRANGRIGDAEGIFDVSLTSLDDSLLLASMEST